jgi:hypothetical protein
MTEMDAPTYFFLGLGFRNPPFHVYTYNQKHGRVYVHSNNSERRMSAISIITICPKTVPFSSYLRITPKSGTLWGLYISPNTNVHQAVWLCRRTRPGSTSLTVAEGASVQFDSLKQSINHIFFFLNQSEIFSITENFSLGPFVHGLSLAQPNTEQ